MGPMIVPGRLMMPFKWCARTGSYPLIDDSGYRALLKSKSEAKSSYMCEILAYVH